MKSRTCAKLLGLLLVFAGSAHATCTTAIFTEEGALIGLLALLSLFIVALVYMASQAFQRVEWEAWAKRAGIGVGVSLILIVAINLVILTGCAVSYELIHKDMFTASTSYLNHLAYSTGFPLIYSLMEDSYQNQLESLDFKYTANPLGGGFGDAKHAGEKTKANAQDVLVNLLMPMIASLYAQQIVLQVIERLVIPIFLPIAFVMRIFPQTRTAADYLIAICLGLALILPLTYVLNIAIAETISPPDIISDFSGTPPTPVPGSAAADPDLELSRVTSLIPQAIFLPNLTIVITVSFIMSFSKLLSRGFDVEGLYAH